MKIVYTQGTFDLFHSGHVNLLRRCSDLGDIVYVSLLSDACIEEYRGKKPIMSFDERKSVLESCKYVSHVFEGNNKKTKEEINELINTYEDAETFYVVIGSDWAKKDIYTQYNVDKTWLDQYLIYLPYTDFISSTEIKERIHDEIIY